jgi:ABC-type transport system involved in multi-copper enzyme maturation permease subunit
MTFLPIVGRELRVAARRGATYWTRAAAVVAALGAGIWIYAMNFRGAPKETGMMLFGTLTVLTNIYALLAGLRTTADCLSEEKREGTLGLLFLTDLKSYDIVLGKLAATSLNAFYAMLAVFPVMGLSLLLGGVSPAEFGRVILVSVNNLLFGLAVGLFCSSISRDDRKAVAVTFLIIAFVAALPVVGLIVTEIPPRRPYLLPFFEIPSPGFACFAAFDTNFGSVPSKEAFWISLAFVHVMTWLILAAACVIVPRTWQDRATGAGRGNLAGWLQQWQFGPPEVRRRLRTRLLALNPVLWLVSRERFKQELVFLMLAAVAVLWVGGYAKWGRDFLEFAGIPFALAVHAVLKVWLCNESCRRLAEDRRSGALELLLATPLSVQSILRGQRWALWRQFAWPTVVVLGTDILLMCAGLTQMHGEEGTVLWIVAWLVTMVILIWDLHALSWVGPWMGLVSRTPNRASTSALVRICALPWLIFLAGVMCLALFETIGRLGLSGTAVGTLFIFGWFVVSASTNIFFTGWAMHRLDSSFRQLATNRFETARFGDWGRVLGELLRVTR